MQFVSTEIPEVVLVTSPVYEDERGSFRKVFHAQKFAAVGLPGEFVQDNHSRSSRGVLRGLHYQIQHAQGKLVSVVRGEIVDVAVDLRRSSPTFGTWVGRYLSESNNHLLYIPPGFAHGFRVVSDDYGRYLTSLLESQSLG